MCTKDIHSQLSIDTLKWHLDVYSTKVLIHTRSTLIWHLINSRSIVSRVSTKVSMECWLGIDGVSIKAIDRFSTQMPLHCSTHGPPSLLDILAKISGKVIWTWENLLIALIALEHLSVIIHVILSSTCKITQEVKAFHSTRKSLVQNI